jgi:hypothetical protein
MVFLSFPFLFSTHEHPCWQTCGLKVSFDDVGDHWNCFQGDGWKLGINLNSSFKKKFFVGHFINICP